MATGTKTGGRTAGTSNKRSQMVAEKLDALECDPIEGMARIAGAAERDAATCFSSLIATIKKAIEGNDMEWLSVLLDKGIAGNIKERREHYALAGAMYKELAQYVAPKRKAIEFVAGGDDPDDLVNPDQLTAMAAAVLHYAQHTKKGSKTVPRPTTKPVPVTKPILKKTVPVPKLKPKTKPKGKN